MPNILSKVKYVISYQSNLFHHIYFNFQSIHFFFTLVRVHKSTISVKYFCNIYFFKELLSCSHLKRPEKRTGRVGQVVVLHKVNIFSEKFPFKIYFITQQFIIFMSCQDSVIMLTLFLVYLHKRIKIILNCINYVPKLITM